MDGYMNQLGRVASFQQATLWLDYPCTEIKAKLKDKSGDHQQKTKNKKYK